MDNNKYKVVNGTAYHINTADSVIRILEYARQNRIRIRLWYGDAKTGRNWMEVYDTIGIIGRSTGTYKIPLLIKNSRSIGGSAILDNCIVKITIDKKTVYQHPKFYTSQMEIREASVELKQKGYFFSVFAGDVNIYNCKTRQQAENEILFHMGKRNKAA